MSIGDEEQHRLIVVCLAITGKPCQVVDDPIKDLCRVIGVDRFQLPQQAHSPVELLLLVEALVYTVGIEEQPVTGGDLDFSNRNLRIWVPAHGKHAVAGYFNRCSF